MPSQSAETKVVIVSVCVCEFVCMDIIIQIKNCQWLSRIAQIFTHRDTSKHTQLHACYVCERERKRLEKRT